MDEKIIDYVVKLVHATRYPEQFGIEANLLVNGASPRASIALIKASKAMALINGENFVKTEDIKEVAFDVLRHRLIPSYEAEAEEITSEDIVNKIFEKSRNSLKNVGPL